MGDDVDDAMWGGVGAMVDEMGGMRRCGSVMVGRR